jgi:hypothetical protein
VGTEPGAELHRVSPFCNDSGIEQVFQRGAKAQMRTVHRLKLSDATVMLRRDVELKFSPSESGTADHMTVHHATGNAEDVAIVKSGDSLQVRRMVMHMDIATGPTPAIPAMTGVHFSLADLE